MRAVRRSYSTNKPYTGTRCVKLTALIRAGRSEKTLKIMDSVVKQVTPCFDGHPVRFKLYPMKELHEIYSYGMYGKWWPMDSYITPDLQTVGDLKIAREMEYSIIAIQDPADAKFVDPKIYEYIDAIITVPSSRCDPEFWYTERLMGEIHMPSFTSGGRRTLIDLDDSHPLA